MIFLLVLALDQSQEFLKAEHLQDQQQAIRIDQERGKMLKLEHIYEA